ncbi:ABC transporter permease [Pseudonocardia sp. WMMC193]|uniref:ABC transporter permease n=1 Tax=Pseudonocardia sp. WMMC193 TaxID=2911965 RepID=UPI001F42D156|nr:ABC transporter permease [Pseudonocardia sp. WMMC193]MCF7553659.1 ABC transporter permease [Pseudonocardia sp. WMMC193]
MRLRVTIALGQLAAVTVAVFALTTFLPGDTAEVVLGPLALPEQIEVLRVQLGLDRPVWERFGAWVGGLFRGDLGTSLATGRPVVEDLGARFALTLLLAVLAVVILVPLAVALGCAAGRRPGSVADRLITATTTVAQAVPDFALGLLLVAVFALQLGWLPATGAGTVGLSGLTVSMLVLPVTILVSNQLGRLARQVRIGVVEAAGATHVTHLRRLGLGERTLLLRHVLPGAVVPSLQQVARTVDGLLGGVLVVEALFAMPGIGSGFVSAVQNRDLPVVQAYALLFAVTTVLVNLVADLASARLVPQAVRL